MPMQTKHHARRLHHEVHERGQTRFVGENILVEVASRSKPAPGVESGPKWLRPKIVKSKTHLCRPLKARQLLRSGCNLLHRDEQLTSYARRCGVGLCTAGWWDLVGTRHVFGASPLPSRKYQNSLNISLLPAPSADGHSKKLAESEKSRRCWQWALIRVLHGFGRVARPPDFGLPVAATLPHLRKIRQKCP